MKKKEFIQRYVIQYVADKMARVNRNEVQHADLPDRHTIVAIGEAIQVWDTISANALANHD